MEEKICFTSGELAFATGFAAAVAVVAVGDDAKIS